MEQLSGLDAAFLYLETPQMHMHVALCAVLDPSEMPGGYRFEAIENLVLSRLDRLPPFTRRLVMDPLGLDHPHWIEDPEFDPIHHIRRVSCPAPGGSHELGRLVGRITSRPLPRDRPLWELWVVEGLAEGRFAIVAKVHHSAVDGMMGAGLMVNLFGMTREPAPEAPPPREEEHPVPPEPRPSDIEMLKSAARKRLAQPRKLVDLAKRTVERVGGVVERRRDPELAHGGTPLTAPRTRLNRPIGPQRDVGFARLSLAELKAIKAAGEGAKLNDVLLAVVGGALRRYLAHHDDLPEVPLVATCPIATGAGRGNNNVAAMFVPIATHLAEPEARLEAIQAATRGAKEEHAVLGKGELLQDWADLAPTTTFSVASSLYSRLKLSKHHRPVHNLIVSNVPGPPMPVYLAGAELEAAYPMGPILDGAALNVTVMSYRGQVDFGFMVARDVVPDVWRLADAVAPAFRELRDAVLGAPSEASPERSTPAE